MQREGSWYQLRCVAFTGRPFVTPCISELFKHSRCGAGSLRSKRLNVSTSGGLQGGVAVLVITPRTRLCPSGSLWGERPDSTLPFPLLFIFSSTFLFDLEFLFFTLSLPPFLSLCHSFILNQFVKSISECNSLYPTDMFVSREHCIERYTPTLHAIKLYYIVLA